MIRGVGEGIGKIGGKNTTCFNALGSLVWRNSLQTFSIIEVGFSYSRILLQAKVALLLLITCILSTLITSDVSVAEECLLQNSEGTVLALFTTSC